MNIMKKVLEISDTPSYNTFNDLAFAFSVIEGNQIDYSNWLVAHFIDVYYRKKWNAICFKMPYCYHWRCFKSNLVLYNSMKYNSFINTIEKQINYGKYVYLCVNEKFIPERFVYNKKNFLHNIYIYGYDNEKKIFFTAAYNTSKHFARQEISYKHIYLAQKNKKVKNICISFKLDNSYDFISLKSKKVKLQLFKYFFPLDKYSGINIFKYLKKHYKQDEIKMGYSKLLCEHIQILSKLEQIGYKFDANELIKLSENLYYISLKYTLTNDIKLLNEAQIFIEKIKEFEIKKFKNYFDSGFLKIISKLYMKKYHKYFILNRGAVK